MHVSTTRGHTRCANALYTRRRLLPVISFQMFHSTHLKALSEHWETKVRNTHIEAQNSFIYAIITYTNCMFICQNLILATNETVRGQLDLMPAFSQRAPVSLAIHLLISYLHLQSCKRYCALLMLGWLHLIVVTYTKPIGVDSILCWSVNEQLVLFCFM